MYQRHNCLRRLARSALACVPVVLTAAVAQAQVTIDPIVRSIGANRDEVPGRPYPIVFRGESDVQLPVINQGGDVVFRARSASVFDNNTQAAWGIYAKPAGQPMNVLVDTTIDDAGTPGFAVPGRPAEARFLNFKAPLVNNAGDVIFMAFFTDPVAGTNAGIYATTIYGGPLVKIVDTFDLAPGGGGEAFKRFYFSSSTTEEVSYATLNDAGQVAFYATYGPSTTNYHGIYASTVTGGSIIVLADNTDTIIPTDVPFGTPGGFREVRPDFAMNSSGQVAFHGSIRIGSGSIRRVGVFRVPVTGGVPQTICFQFVTAPDAGSATFQSFSDQDIDENGKITFEASLSDGTQGFFTASAPGGPYGRLVDTAGGYVVPGDIAGAAFTSLQFGPVNAQTVMGFASRVNNSAVANNQGMYIAEENVASIGFVLDRDSTAPGQQPPAVLSNFEDAGAAINDAGNLAFAARGIDSNGTSMYGLYFYDACAQQPVRIVDSLTAGSDLGGTFSSAGSQSRKLAGYQGNAATNGRYRAFTSDNRYVFLAQFSNFDFGIYVATLASAGGQVDITCPADLVLDCPANTDVSSVGMAVAVDACSGAAVPVTFEDSMATVCGPTGTITRTWTADDGAGHTATCTQIIEVVDDVDPQLVGLPADLLAECDAVPAPADVTATDACDAAPALSFTETTIPGACSGDYMIERAWEALDACGNMATAAQTISVVDTTAPTIACPADLLDLACGADTSIAATGEATASDNCGNATVSATDVVTAGCGQTETVTRTWAAEDDCGNTATCVQTVATADHEPPTLVGVPADETVECDAIPAPAPATATDGCDPAPIVTLDEITTPGSCPNAATLVRTWTAEDACGNAASAAQTLTVTDTTAPTIACPADVFDLPCDADLSPASTGSAAGSDNCGPVDLAYTDESVPGCGLSQTVTRTWTATDACGLTATCVQTITTVDAAAPTISCPADVVDLPCGADTSPANTGSATADDDCGAATVAYADAGVPGCGDTETITRTWTATDACGNSATCVQTVATVDDTPPVLTVDTTPIVVSDPTCSGNTTVTLPVATATDDCGAATVTHDAPASFPTGTTTVTFEAEDDCGNVSTATLDVTVEGGGAAIEVHALRYVLGRGRWPIFTKEPIVGAQVCAYERSRGSCPWDECRYHLFSYNRCVVNNCAPVACGVTDANGWATLNVPPGNYIVIAEDLSGLLLPDPLGWLVGDLDCGETAYAPLRQIVRADGRRIACIISRLIGSELLVIQPEEMLWDGEEQVYPFVFESVGAWDVTVSVEPPDGFVPDVSELSDTVINEDSALQFTITELGSDLLPTDTRFEIEHDGRFYDVSGKVNISLTSRYARQRGFNVRTLNAKGLIRDAQAPAPRELLRSIERVKQLEEAQEKPSPTEMRKAATRTQR